MKQIFLLVILFLLSATAMASTPCSEMVRNEFFPTTTIETVTLCHTRMVIGYSTGYKDPIWVAEKLTATETSNENIKRKDHFRQDSLIGTNDQASLSTYTHSGYDRGHMAPYEDFADDEVAADESFLLTNIVPQNPRNNRIIWRSLEEHVREYTKEYSEIYIITGPIFEDVGELADGTRIPSKLFKLISYGTQVDVYIIPNNGMYLSVDLPKFKSSLEELQKEDPLIKEFIR